MAKKIAKKTFLGMPMNWDMDKPFRNLWNENDDKLFPPKSFGIGWTVNFHAVFRKVGIIKPPSVKKTNKRKGS